MSWNVGYRKMNRKRNEEKRRARECPFCGSLEVRSSVGRTKTSGASRSEHIIGK